jgi:pyrimidine deaminase RibD-like protein
MLTQERIHGLCAAAVAEAKKSVREDERHHPLVGAVLADRDGEIVTTSYRGETLGGHAEFNLLEKVAGRNVDLTSCTLFVTLEPCIRRGRNKIPCAVRVAQSGIKTVYIGMIDPDPNITGRGEMYLTYEGVSVGHFSLDLAEELKAINSTFLNRFRAAHFWEPPPPSLYGANLHGSLGRPQPARTREGMLYQTLDLMVGSSGPIWISAGNLSWFRELQVAFVAAALDNREVRVIRHGLDQPGATLVPTSVASSLGASVLEQVRPKSLRFTLVGPNTSAVAAIVVERGSALLLRTPDEPGMLGVLTEWFEQTWERQEVQRARSLSISDIPIESVFAALRKYVPQYKSLPITLEDVAIDSVRPASRKLEAFKLFRINQFAALRARHTLPEIARIEGSPWPLVAPPVIERLPNGSLVLIDGTHRAYSSRARGESTIRAIVVDNPNYDLPSQPAASWSEVDILTEKLPRAERYSKFLPLLFRPIRAAFESLAGAPLR